MLMRYRWQATYGPLAAHWSQLIHVTWARNILSDKCQLWFQQCVERIGPQAVTINATTAG
jgi:hypothetical protein